MTLEERARDIYVGLTLPLIDEAGAMELILMHLRQAAAEHCAARHLPTLASLAIAKWYAPRARDVMLGQHIEALEQEFLVALREAVAAERDRCEKIALNYANKFYTGAIMIGERAAAQTIARLIEEGVEP